MLNSPTLAPISKKVETSLSSRSIQSSVSGSFVAYVFRRHSVIQLSQRSFTRNPRIVTGLSQLHIQDATPGAALHTESRAALDLTRAHKPVIWREGVYTMTLDAFCQETGLNPQGVKIDVDGTELEILEGATRTLRSPMLRSLVVEMFRESPSHAACAQR